MYKHYFKTEDTTMMTIIAYHRLQRGSTLQNRKHEKETRFVLPVTRAPAFSADNNEVGTERGRGCSRTVLAVLFKMSIHSMNSTIWAVYRQQLNILNFH